MSRRPTVNEIVSALDYMAAKSKREGYVPPTERKKILLLADDFRFPSGVGTMSKELILGTCHVFNWVQLGAGVNHYEAGKIVNMNKAVADETGVSDAQVTLYPYNGYGDSTIVRQLLATEKPDAIMIFTDPRYWIWLFSMEREIRTQIPILYLNIWDNLPYPMYNQSYYKSCDGLFAISKQTLNVNRVVLGEDVDNHILRYIPHGVSSHYKLLDRKDEELIKFKESHIPAGHEFVLLYNARNIGRKQTSDIILAWSDFCNSLPEEEAKKCLLYLHTDPVDNAGTNLPAVADVFCDSDRCHVLFDGNKYTTQDMNLLYNSADGVILTSAAEGWGLSVTEAMMTGKMFIGTVTGGIQDQMRFEDENGNWINFSKTFPSNHLGTYKKHGSWCIPVYPRRGLVGSPVTPYIFDDRPGAENIAEAIKELYSLGKVERIKRGKEGYQWATSEEAGFTAEIMSKRFIDAVNDTLEFHKNHPRSRNELIKIQPKKPSTRVQGFDPMHYSIPDKDE